MLVLVLVLVLVPEKNAFVDFQIFVTLGRICGKALGILRVGVRAVYK